MFLKSGWPWTSRVWEGYEDNFDRTVGPGVIVLLYSVMFAVLLTVFINADNILILAT